MRRVRSGELTGGLDGLWSATAERCVFAYAGGERVTAGEYPEVCGNDSSFVASPAPLYAEPGLDLADLRPNVEPLVFSTPLGMTPGDEVELNITIQVRLPVEGSNSKRSWGAFLECGSKCGHLPNPLHSV